jgi:hypothetical protein
MLSFSMTDAQFAAATTRLRAAGIELTGPTGTLSKDGITATYAYAAGTLTVEIVDKPFFVPVSMIEGKLKEYFQQNVASGDSR